MLKENSTNWSKRGNWKNGRDGLVGVKGEGGDKGEVGVSGEKGEPGQSVGADTLHEIKKSITPFSINWIRDDVILNKFEIDGLSHLNKEWNFALPNMHSLWKGSFTLVANYYVEDITGRIDWMLEFSENPDSSPIVQFGPFHGHLSDSASVKFILIKFLFLFTMKVVFITNLHHFQVLT